MNNTENKEEIKEQNVWHILFSLLFLAGLGLLAYVLSSAGRLPRKISVFDFVILGLAIFRLAHLFVYDYIMHFVRDFFEKFKSGPFRTVANVLECPWCTGMWMSLFVTFFFFYFYPFSWYIILTIALAALGTLINITALLISRK